MTSAFRLTPRAAAHLDAIADHSLEKGGLGQLDQYLRSLNSRFEWLAANPFAGRERNDVHPCYRRFPEGSHIILYIVSDEYVDIIGIPHKSVDIGPDLF
jgi:toxin ParE1/3/4